MKKLRVGVVGVGHIGGNHARLYAEIPAAEFTAIHDVDLARANTISRKHRVTAAESLGGRVGPTGRNHPRLYAEIPAAEFTAIHDVDLARANTISRKHRVTAAKSL